MTITQIGYKIQKKVPKPNSIDSPWVSRDYAAEILSKPVIDLRFGDLRALLLGRYEQSLWFLPDAIDFMRNDPDGNEIISSVMGFVFCHQENMRKDGLWVDAIAELNDVFWGWTRIFKPAIFSDADFDGCVPLTMEVDNFNRDDYLDNYMIISESNLCEDMFLLLLNGWVEDLGCPDRSAHLIDFFLHLRGNPVMHRKVYSSGAVEAILGDRNVLIRHWNLSRGIVGSVCSCEYVSTIDKIMAIC